MKTLETERLRLTMFTMEDAADLYDYAKNPNVGPHAGWSPHKSREESEIIIRDLFLPNETWAIRMKDETKADGKPGKVIGSISLEPDRYRPDANSKELGYSLSEDYWKQGIMTEAAKEVIRFAFEELGLSQIGICTCLLYTSESLIISGKNLHIEALDLEEGRMVAFGEIDSFVYAKKKSGRRLWERLGRKK